MSSSPSEQYTIRRATAAEAERVVAHRRSMFFDMGYRDPWLEEMTVVFRPWLLRKMESGDYLEWFATGADGAVVAGAGLWLMEWMPHRAGGRGRRGNVLNVYTERGHRRRGLARRLMETVVGWCRAEGVEVVILHASDEGRPLYESMGFKATNEMRIDL